MSLDKFINGRRQEDVAVEETNRWLRQHKSVDISGVRMSTFSYFSWKIFDHQMKLISWHKTTG